MSFFASRLFQSLNSTPNSVQTNFSFDSLNNAQVQEIQSSVVSSVNTIRLASTASSVDDYYVGYDIIVKKVLPDGQSVIQTRTIQSYNGSTRVVTVTQTWDTGSIPDTTFTYQIVPSYKDARVSINPAIQTMDYITSKVYGRGLDTFQDLRLQSWLSSARQCDRQSDVTVAVSSTQNLRQGSTYFIQRHGRLSFQGQIKFIKPGYVTFTKVLGKLTHKWFSWKSYQVGDLIYNKGRIYSVQTAGTKPQPVHTSGTQSGLVNQGSNIQLVKRQGTGSANINISTSENPVRDQLQNGTIISGYSLYDADGVDFFRLLGWDQHSQRNCTAHQVNTVIDTSQPLFQNINNLLQQFGGILRYSQGLYDLQVQKVQTQFVYIQQKDIIGTINIVDQSNRNSFNSLTVAYSDPSNKFQARNISFRKSIYVTQDRNVPRSGNLSIPGVTNYYNARLLADRYLQQSRRSLAISFTLTPQFIKLQAGNVIRLTYPRFGWVNKQFRVQSLSIQSDTQIFIQAQQYSPIFYSGSNVFRQQGTGLAGTRTQTQVAGPTNLISTSAQTNNQKINTIQLSWINNPSLSGAGAFTQVLCSNSSKYYLVATSISGNVIRFSQAHQLQVGDSIRISTSTQSGLTVNRRYFVRQVIDDNRITLSVSLDGGTLSLSNNTSPNLTIITASVVATLPIPQNVYNYNISSATSGRVSKYFWVRHKVTK